MKKKYSKFKFINFKNLYKIKIIQKILIFLKIKFQMF